MSDKQHKDPFENRLKELFENWEALYEAGEANADWGNLKENIPTGSPPAGEGLTGFFSGGGQLIAILSAVVVSSVVLYAVLTKDDATEKESSEISTESALPNSPEALENNIFMQRIFADSAFNEDLTAKQRVSDDFSEFEAERREAEAKNDEIRKRENLKQEGAAGFGSLDNIMPVDNVDANKKEEAGESLNENIKNEKADAPLGDALINHYTTKQKDDSVYCGLLSYEQRSGLIPADEPHTYYLAYILKNDDGSTDTLKRKILESGNVQAAFNAQLLEGRMYSFDNLSIGAETYYWNFGDGEQSEVRTPAHEFKSDGNYRVMLVAENYHQCRDTAVYTLNVRPDYQIEIPNVFTPDGDGMNDYFVINSGAVDEYRITIMDRNGNKVFHSTDIEEHWDGKDHGSGTACEQGTYYYVIDILYEGAGQKERITGTVTLLRNNTYR